jgi:hypothetical protein
MIKVHHLWAVALISLATLVREPKTAGRGRAVSRIVADFAVLPER